MDQATMVITVPIMVATMVTGTDITTTTIIITEEEEALHMLTQATATDMVAAQVTTQTEEEGTIPILQEIHHATVILMATPDLRRTPETTIIPLRDQTTIPTLNRISLLEVIQIRNQLLRVPTRLALLLRAPLHLMEVEVMVAEVAVVVEDPQVVAEDDKKLKKINIYAILTSRMDIFFN